MTNKDEMRECFLQSVREVFGTDEPADMGAIALTCLNQIFQRGIEWQAVRAGGEVVGTIVEQDTYAGLTCQHFSAKINQSANVRHGDKLYTAPPTPAAKVPEGLINNLISLEKHVREEADFNRSWADGRRGDQNKNSDEYNARRIEAAQERESWADDIIKVVSLLSAAPQPVGDGDSGYSCHKCLKPTDGPGPFKMYVWCADCQASTSASIAKDLAQPPEGEQ